jgi:hypothetical protein
MRRPQLALLKVSRLLVGAFVLVALSFAQDLRAVKPETVGLSSGAAAEGRRCSSAEHR